MVFLSFRPSVVYQSKSIRMQCYDAWMLGLVMLMVLSVPHVTLTTLYSSDGRLHPPEGNPSPDVVPNLRKDVQHKLAEQLQRQRLRRLEASVGPTAAKHILQRGDSVADHLQGPARQKHQLEKQVQQKLEASNRSLPQASASPLPLPQARSQSKSQPQPQPKGDALLSRIGALEARLAALDAHMPQSHVSDPQLRRLARQHLQLLISNLALQERLKQTHPDAEAAISRDNDINDINDDDPWAIIRNFTLFPMQVGLWLLHAVSTIASATRNIISRHPLLVAIIYGLGLAYLLYSHWPLLDGHYTARLGSPGQPPRWSNPRFF